MPASPADAPRALLDAVAERVRQEVGPEAALHAGTYLPKLQLAKDFHDGLLGRLRVRTAGTSLEEQQARSHILAGAIGRAEAELHMTTHVLDPLQDLTARLEATRGRKATQLILLALSTVTSAPHLRRLQIGEPNESSFIHNRSDASERAQAFRSQLRERVAHVEALGLRIDNAMTKRSVRTKRKAVLALVKDSTENQLLSSEAPVSLSPSVDSSGNVHDLIEKYRRVQATTLAFEDLPNETDLVSALDEAIQARTRVLSQMFNEPRYVEVGYAFNSSNDNRKARLVEAVLRLQDGLGINDPEHAVGPHDDAADPQWHEAGKRLLAVSDLADFGTVDPYGRTSETDGLDFTP